MKAGGEGQEGPPGEGCPGPALPPAEPLTPKVTLRKAGVEASSPLPPPEVVPDVTIMEGFESSESEDEDEPSPFRLFTQTSYTELLAREDERKRVEKEKKDSPQEGRLVDGELKFGDDDDDEPPPERDQALIEGNTLPVSLDGTFPQELFGKPLEEIDKYLKDKVRIFPSL